MHRRVKPSDFFLLRTPRLPIENFDKIGSHGSEKEFWEFALKYLKDPQILDAIGIASKDLFDQIILNINLSFNENTRKILPAIYKYLSRMSLRPTPFGKFSSVSLGKITPNSTGLILTDKYNSKYRFDYEIIELINNILMANKNILKNVVFYPNSTISESQDSVTYLEYSVDGTERKFMISRFSHNPLIRRILKETKNGKTFHQITNLMVKVGIDQATAENFINRLILNKILIPETEPVTTINNSDNFLQLSKKLSLGTALYSNIDNLSQIIRKVELDDKISSNSSNLFSTIKDLGPEPKTPFQVDTYRLTETANLCKDDLKIFVKDLFDLLHLNKSNDQNHLHSFRKKFITRYGDQEVPLMEALDYEKGIGYGNQTNFYERDCPIIQGLTFLSNHKNLEKNFSKTIIDRYYSCGNHSSKVIELSEKDNKSLSLDAVTDTKIRIPSGFYLFGTLLEEKSQKKEYRFLLKFCGGVSGLPLLTRFSHLDKILETKLREYAKTEEKNFDEGILAEIVYYPKPKAANILTRPSLYEYEIPIIGRSSVDEAHTLLMEDIFVSIREGKILLRSKKLNKIIRPRLTSAHNFHYGMTLYRFLCDIQQYECPLNIRWNWPVESNKPFYPRVTYKSIILSRAQWYIKKTELNNNKLLTIPERVELIKQKFQIPKTVLLAEGDNELLIDLESEVGKKIFFKELGRKDLTLIEDIYLEYDTPVVDSKGKTYANEVIIPFLGEKNSKPIPISTIIDPKIKRTFIPGSEWIYIKIYSGEKEAEKILRNEIFELVETLKQENKIKKWFFVRYKDPDPHIRLRFEINGDLDKGFLSISRYLNESFGSLIEAGRIYRFVFDTYERELERYGHKNIDLCESIFNVESEAVIKFLKIINKHGEHMRWQIALFMLKEFLSIIDSDRPKTIAYLNKLRDKFLKEFKSIPKVKYKLDMNYRENRNRLSLFINNFDHGINFVMEQYKKDFSGLAEQLKKAPDPIISHLDILPSLTHMLLNRLFFTNQRQHEMTIYHFLSKFLIGELKREIST